MSAEPTIQRVLLAVEGSDLEAGGREYCAGILPGCDIDVLPIDEFAKSLDEEADPETLRVLMLHADADGKLSNGSTIVQSVMSSNVPVLVTRCSQGGTMPDAPIKQVVVPLDGSAAAGQAVPVASRVAQMKNVPVRFLMVIDPSRVLPPAYAYDPDAWGMIESLRQTSHWALSQAESAMERDGVMARSDLLFGPLNATLAANINEGDLVVMTTHGPDRHRQRHRDSVTMRTLVSVPQPMLLMQAETEEPVIVDGYQACSWVEPLQNKSAGAR